VLRSGHRLEIPGARRWAERDGANHNV
jgi:hypothetical protein